MHNESWGWLCAGGGAILQMAWRVFEKDVSAEVFSKLTSGKDSTLSELAGFLGAGVRLIPGQESEGAGARLYVSEAALCPCGGAAVCLCGVLCVRMCCCF
jgi:hypothetical protein